MSNTDKYTKYEPDLQKTHFDNKDLQLSALSDSNLGVKEAAKSQDDKSEHQAGKIFVKKPFDGTQFFVAFDRCQHHIFDNS